MHLPHIPPNYTDHDLGLLVFVIAPAVALLCWLYNAKKSGKFKKAKQPPPDISLRPKLPKWLLVLCGAVLGILLGLAIRML